MIRVLLAVDPGIRGSGAALFDLADNHMVRASYVKSFARHGGGPREAAVMAHAITAWCAAQSVMVSTIVMEWPQIYMNTVFDKDKNDLLPLAGVDAALCAIIAAERFIHYKPREWKGQIPKYVEGQPINEIMRQRVLSRLTPAEAATIHDDGELTHNTYDAIGIGLHHLGLFKRTRVIAR